ncbi:MAG: hypothetical protein OEZ13_13815 [Spirochaetia bacterium]|nr:hypothetical protein [Spirochaetia bacterium]
MKYKLLSIALILTGYFTEVIGQEAQENESSESVETPEKKAGENLVKRRVLILDFTNAQNNKNYSYLEVSIPDAFLEPLDKTKSFELLKRNEWQKMIKASQYKQEDAYDEDTAVSAAKAVQADVVVIGMFVVSGPQMQMFSKAIEVSSGRVIVNRAKRTDVDSNMFGAIDELALDMSAEMKDKLPPVPQKVLVQERVKYVDTGKITYGGMLWRSALIPGWGHTYAMQKRGWAYLGLWALSAGAFGYFAYDTSAKKEVYEKETSLGEIDNKYNAYSSSFKIRGYASYALIGSYIFALTDILFFGKGYSSKSDMKISFMPSVENGSINLSGNSFSNSGMRYKLFIMQQF